MKNIIKWLKWLKRNDELVMAGWWIGGLAVAVLGCAF